MPVLRVDNYIDAYRIRAKAADIHELAGRPEKQALTEFVNHCILDTLRPGPFDVVVDVGCGDGTFLKVASSAAQKCVGITPTEEEKAALQRTFPLGAFEVGTVQSLPLPSETASKVVCNAVLIYLGSVNEIKASLRELARIARPSATVWIGEIPEIDEYAHYGMYRGTSMRAFLWFLLRNHGLRSFLGMCRRWLMAAVGKEQIILNSAGLFYASPATIIALAEECGLHLKTYFRHKELDERGRPIDSNFRYDYIFTK
jgi:SAM-dependent methyltransferase